MFSFQFSVGIQVLADVYKFILLKIWSYANSIIVLLLDQVVTKLSWSATSVFIDNSQDAIYLLKCTSKTQHDTVTFLLQTWDTVLQLNRLTLHVMNT